MGEKRKANVGQHKVFDRPEKKPKQVSAPVDNKSKLLLEPRADWYAAELPALETNEVTALPPQRAIDELHQYAKTLLETENATYQASHLTGSAAHKFMTQIMASGTLEDKISALTLLVQESPLHTMKAFENLVGMSKKKSRNQALAAIAALKDLLGQGMVLPGDRKLRAFGKQPGLLAAMQGKNGDSKASGALPGSVQKTHLMVWAYEDWLKKTYFELLQVLENWCNDEVEYARSRAITYVWELLKDKPEQEENLLRLLVNKLGDTDRKIASRASYLLLQLETSHPAMRMVVTNSIEADCLFRPGQSLHAKYYATITLNQTILSQKEEAVANRLLEIYFSLFVQFLKPKKDEKGAVPKPKLVNGKPQGGGGKPGKMAMKKAKAEERSAEADDQLKEKLVAQVLTGVNRAFPFADTNNPTFEKQLDTIFRIAHSSNFNTSLQALMLLQQISSTKHYGAERFYRTLYESLLDPRLFTSSKQVMYLNLLYKSLKADLNAKRVQAFVKRLLQIITLHEPPFVCGVLYLISELEGTFPSIRNMLKDPEYDEEDEEEHFVDVPEEGETETSIKPSAASANTKAYDPRKRDPEHAHADRTCLWDLLPFLRHFHPSVSLFAEALVYNTKMPPKPEPTQHSLMQFLDRFVYRNAKSKAIGTHGSSIMQPLGGSSSADLLVKPSAHGERTSVPVNTESFWAKKVEDVAADEVFFHSYFNQTTNKKRKTPKKSSKRDGDDSEDEDEGEDEVWQALVNSRPDVEGPDEDDDISIGDLEDAYSDDEDGSEAGLDLGGSDDEDGSEPGLDMGGEESDEAVGDDDGFPDFDDEDEDAFLDDDDEIPVDLDDDEEDEEDTKELSKSQKKRKEKKKLKNLPVFASIEDYAKLLDAEPDDM
ncbi:ribosome biogenesis protein noc1 [Acrodontium crateriforme]|uniref:Ribosome biogenesis protein noc1 n=1 Tax=Acrodontium crateriforme TaxID=150365 RepID=A0AAQ3M010_9PEZI|nr:ribosome biogenesis protein noc1 [Acrodontium crateriforme]